MNRPYKRTFLLLLLACLVGRVGAQNIGVESFHLLENDLTANLEGTVRHDQNGNVAALIKVVTTQTGFAFDGGMAGIVEVQPQNSQHPGEVWVYVPSGIARLTIQHPQLGVLRGYSIPVPVEAARTYEMVLAAGRVEPIVIEQDQAQFVVFRVTPSTAMVFIDEKMYQPDVDGMLQELLSYGKHSYRVSAPGYITENGQLEVTSKKLTLDVALQSAAVTLTLECPMAEAELVLNDKVVGTGSWTGTVTPGTYIIETRRTGHRSRKETVTLAEREVRTITLKAPQPMYGGLKITARPVETEVALDGTPVGSTPLLLSDVLVGEHTLSFTKQDYQSATRTVTVEEGKTAEVTDVVLSDVVDVVLHSDPEGAALTFDGSAAGTTPYRAQLSSGDYRIALQAKGYAPCNKTIHVTPSTAEQTITMQRLHLSRNGAYLGAGYTAGTGVPALTAAFGFYAGGVHAEVYGGLPQTGEATAYYNLVRSNGTIYKPQEVTLKGQYLVGGNVGYGIVFDTHLRVTPRAGARLTTFSGTHSTWLLQGTAGLKVEYAFLRWLALTAEPVYAFAVKEGSTFTLVAPYADGLSACRKGFGVNIGLQLCF